MSHNVPDKLAPLKKRSHNSAAATVAAEIPPRERRYIYSGDPQDKTPGYAVRPNNRRMKTPRKRNTFNIVIAWFIAALGAVAYISNLLAVRQLTVEVHQLQKQYEKISNTNAVLKADISRKSALERIGVLATQQLGLIYPKERPERLEVDASKLEQFGNR